MRETCRVQFELQGLKKNPFCSKIELKIFSTKIILNEQITLRNVKLIIIVIIKRAKL